VLANYFLFEEKAIMLCHHFQLVFPLSLLSAEKFLSFGGFLLISIHHQEGGNKRDWPTYFCNTKPIRNYPLIKIKEAQNAYIHW